MLLARYQRYCGGTSQKIKDKAQFWVSHTGRMPSFKNLLRKHVKPHGCVQPLICPFDGPSSPWSSAIASSNTLRLLCENGSSPFRSYRQSVRRPPPSPSSTCIHLFPRMNRWQQLSSDQVHTGYLHPNACAGGRCPEATCCSSTWTPARRMGSSPIAASRRRWGWEACRPSVPYIPILKLRDMPALPHST